MDKLFVMDQPATFTWPVKVPVPVAGKYLFAEFTAEFPNLSEDEVDVLLLPDAEGKRKTDRELAGLVLQGFADLKTPDGGEVKYSEETKAALLRGSRVASAVVGTFMLAVRGLAAEKN